MSRARTGAPRPHIRSSGVHLPATGLLVIEHDGVPETLRQLDGCPARAREQCVVHAGDEQPMRIRRLARIGRGDTAVDVEQVAGRLARPVRRGEVQDRLRDVRRQDVDAERRALAVVLLQLVGLDPVGVGALVTPAGVPDPRALKDRVGVDGVDADPRGPALLGQVPAPPDCVPTRPAKSP